MPTDYSRRELLQAALAGLFSATLPAQARPVSGPPTIPGLPLTFKSPKLEKYVMPLPIPPRQPAAGAIVLAEGQHVFHRDLPPSRTWGYGGMPYLGPTLEAKAGEQPVVEFVNALGPHVFAENIDPTLGGVTADDAAHPPVSVHVHGAPNEAIYDGNPMMVFRPGQSFKYRFRMPGEASHLWYHDHAVGLTRLNVYAGLAGHFWVRDAWDTGEADNPLGLPAGDYEWPITLQDKLFSRKDGSLSYYQTPVTRKDQWQGGFGGDVMCVNGAAWPNAEVARGLYRFRLLNGSSQSGYNLYFSNGMRFWVIGGDGGLLDAPMAVTSVRIDPGIRVDVLVDFSSLQAGERVQLLNNQQAPMLSQIIGQQYIPEVMQFTAVSAQGFAGPVPASLRGGANQPPRLPEYDTPSRVRTITLQDALQITTPFIYMTMNNMLYSDGDIEMPEQGTVEQWDIVNMGPALSHVFHIHLVQFRVLNRSYFNTREYRALNPRPPVGTRWTPDVEPYTLGYRVQPPEVEEMGWKDTVFLPAQTVTRLLIRFPTRTELGFDPDASFVNPFTGETLRGYVMHCHVLDHEDHEMMQRWRAIVPGAPADGLPGLAMCRPR